METLTAVSAVTNMLAAVAQEIEGFQKMFTIESAKVSLKSSEETPAGRHSEQIVQKLQRELQMRTRRLSSAKERPNKAQGSTSFQELFVMLPGNT
jgi:hypothetical protein